MPRPDDFPAHWAVLEEGEILEVLQAIESGSLQLTPDADPDSQVIVEYKVSNGWRIWVFNDAGQWDYLVRIVSEDRRGCSDEQIEAMPEVSAYQPDDEISWQRYGLPGAGWLGCLFCGQRRPLAQGRRPRLKKRDLHCACPKCGLPQAKTS